MADVEWKVITNTPSLQLLKRILVMVNGTTLQKDLSMNHIQKKMAVQQDVSNVMLKVIE